MQLQNFVAALSALSLVAAAPAHEHSHRRFHDHRRRGLQADACANPVNGLSEVACKLLSSISFLTQGLNSFTNNGVMWIGNDGPNTFTFTNGGNEEMTVVGWNMPAGSFTAMDLNVSPGQITYSLDPGHSVTISLANGISGAFSGVYADTKLVNGQVSETWLEYTTGNSATIDVSREVRGDGHSIAAVVQGTGCKSNMDTCVFKCNGGLNICGEAGSYSLLNCDNGSQPGASFGLFAGQASGGCQGFSNGGHVDVHMNGDNVAPPSPPSSAPAPPPPSPTPPPPETTSATPTPTPTPTEVVQTVPNELVAVPTPTPTPTDEPLAVVAVPGSKFLQEISEAFAKVYSGSSSA